MPTGKGVANQFSSAPSEGVDTISERLLQARRSAMPLPAFPGTLPSDLETAYAVQHRSIHKWPDEVAGWKVGGISPPFATEYAATRLVGPIFKRQIIFASNSEPVMATVFDDGFAAVEAEFVLCTAVPIKPSGSSIDKRRLTDSIASVHIGAEIASSPMANINDLGPGAIISDFGNNAGLIVGPPILDWRQRCSEHVGISVLVNDETVGSVRTSVEDDAFNALEFLIELSNTRGIELPAGTFVTCGALSGIHEMKSGDRSSVVFEELGTLNIQFAKRQPTV